MLTDEQKEILSDALTPLYQHLEAEIIADIARRIKKTMTYTRTAELQVIAMQKLGYNPAKIRSEVMKQLRADKDFQGTVEKNTLEYKQDVKQLIRGITEQAQVGGNGIVANAGDMSWIDDMRVWESAGKELNTQSRLTQITRALAQQTQGELKNLTRSTGFKTMSGFESTQNLYRVELDKALVKMSSGAFSSDQCIKDVVKDLAQSGIRTIDYASGRTYQLDTSARMCLRTASNQVSAQVMNVNVENTGETLVQVSAHWGARNKGEGIANHELWQGGIYSIDGKPHPEEEKRIGRIVRDLLQITGYDAHIGQGEVQGLHGVNCRHQHFAFFEGISTPVVYPLEPKPKTINGREYDYYAITQKQRQLERGIRALKREREALKALGWDTTDIQAKIRQKTVEYKQFSSECGISPKMNRVRVEGGTSDLTKTRAWQDYQKEKDRAIEKKLDLGNVRGIKFQKSADNTNLSQENVDIIKNTISDLSREYDLRLDEFEIGDYTDSEYITSPMFCRAIDDNGLYRSRLVINNACEFWSNRNIREKVFNEGYFAGKSVKDFTEHELAHVLTFQRCNTVDDYIILEKEIRPLYTNGVSKYAYCSRDGAETIAEAFVKSRNGKSVNDGARGLMEKYVEVCRKC